MTSSAPAGSSPEDAVAFAEGVLGAAGHEVADPRMIDLIEKRAAGEISGDEYRRAVLDG